jgi:hypothetical protein
MPEAEKVESDGVEAGEGRQAEASTASTPTQEAAPSAVTPSPAPSGQDRTSGGGAKPAGSSASAGAASGAPRGGGAWGRTYNIPKTSPEDYALSPPAKDALSVFQALDNKAKEGFLAQAGILALSYRKWEGEGADNYGVVFPEITLHARAIVESIARFTAGIQRLQDETKFGSLITTPRMFLLIAQQSSLWETATPEHLVDLLEAVEFEAAYRTVNDFQRRSLFEFRDYEPLDDTHDLEALYEHYAAFKRKRYRDYARRRFEFWREFPRRPRQPQRPGDGDAARRGGPGGTTAQTPGASRRTEARPAQPRPAQTPGRPGSEKSAQAQSPARSDTGKGDPARNTARPATSTAAKPARGSRKSPAAAQETTSAETQSDAAPPAASPAAAQPAPAPSPAAAQPPAMNLFA